MSLIKWYSCYIYDRIIIHKNSYGIYISIYLSFCINSINNIFRVSHTYTFAVQINMRETEDLFFISQRNRCGGYNCKAPTVRHNDIIFNVRTTLKYNSRATEKRERECRLRDICKKTRKWERKCMCAEAHATGFPRAPLIRFFFLFHSRLKVNSFFLSRH